MKIPTLFSNYDELMLDIDVYGKKVSSPQLTIPELREKLFEDFKRSKPFPTLTSRRYELSNLVSEDYKIEYNRQLEFQESESEIDLKTNYSYIKPDLSDLEQVNIEIRKLFTYESRTTDEERQRLLEKYDLVTGEEFERGINETEKLFGSVKENESLVLSDEDINSLGSEEKSFTYSEDSEDTFSYSEESEDSDYPDFDEESEEEDLDDEDYPDFDEESEEEDLDDEDYPDFDEESEEEDLEDDYPDFDDEESEEDNSDDEDYPDFEEDKEDSKVVKQPEEKVRGTPIEVDEDLSGVEIDIDTSDIVVDIPRTPIEAAPKIVKEEQVDRSLEPTDIRQFLRKHPRSTMEFVLKYFTKKQINDALRIGKIIKKGNILKLP